MFHFRSRYPIAIDVGTNVICATQLKQNRQGFIVRGFFREERKEDRSDDVGADAELTSVLKKIVRHRAFIGKRVALHLPPDTTFSFPLHFQVGGSESIEEAIIRGSREYLSFPLEEAVLDYPSVIPLPPEGSGQYKATVIAVQKPHIEQYLRVFKRLGVTVEVVDFLVCSLIRLHNFLGAIAEKPVIVCHIGDTRTLLSVIARDGILAERLIPWGLNTIIKKLTTNLDGMRGTNDARRLLRRYGLAYEGHKRAGKVGGTEVDSETDTLYRVIYQLIIPSIEELVDELYKIIAYLRSEERNIHLEGIHIYGDGAMINHLDHYVQERLNIPSNVMDIMSRFSVEENAIRTHSDYLPLFAPVLGLAMRSVTWH